MSQSTPQSAAPLPVHKLRPPPRRSSASARQPSPPASGVPSSAAPAPSEPGPQPVVLVGCGSYNPPTVMHLRMFDLAADALREEGRLEVWGGYLSPVSDAYRKPGLAPATHRLAMCEAAAEGHPFVACDAWEANQPHYTRTLQVLQRYQAEVDAWWAAGGHAAQAQHSQPGPSEETQQQHQEQQEADEGQRQGAGSVTAPEGSGTQHDGAAGGLIGAPQGRKPPRAMLLCGEDVLLSMTIPGVWEDPEGVLTQYGAVCIERPPAPSAGGAVAMGAAIAPGGAVKQGLGSLQEALERPDNVLSRCRQHIHVVRDVARTNISSTLVRGELRAGRSVRYLVPDGVERYLERHPDVYAGCGR